MYAVLLTEYIALIFWPAYDTWHRPAGIDTSFIKIG